MSGRTQIWCPVAGERVTAGQVLAVVDSPELDNRLQNIFMVNVFSGIVILLPFVTALGIFGITAYSVTQRTKQIGTRRALGAPN